MGPRNGDAQLVGRMGECVICSESMCETGCTLECGHTFHAMCIVRWFRQEQSCPLCRASHTTRFTVSDVQSRAKLLRLRARRKDAPPELRRLVAKWKLQEMKVDLLRKAVRALRRSNAAVLREEKALLNRLRKWRQTTRMAQRMVGLYADDSIKIPLLVSGRRK